MAKTYVAHVHPEIAPSLSEMFTAYGKHGWILEWTVPYSQQILGKLTTDMLSIFSWGGEGEPDDTNPVLETYGRSYVYDESTFADHLATLQA